MNQNGDEILVVKKDIHGNEEWRYRGRVVEQNDSALLLEAPFNRADVAFEGIVLKNGDLFIEIYFSDRWYNIYSIFDRDSRALKAWYCNVCRPASFSAGRVEFIDLALDLLVYPDGWSKVLDMDEYEALALDGVTRSQACQALAELEALFDVLPSGILPSGLHSGLALEIGGWHFPTTS